MALVELPRADARDFLFTGFKSPKEFESKPASAQIIESYLMDPELAWLPSAPTDFTPKEQALMHNIGQVLNLLDPHGVAGMMGGFHLPNLSKMITGSKINLLKGGLPSIEEIKSGRSLISRAMENLYKLAGPGQRREMVTEIGPSLKTLLEKEMILPPIVGRKNFRIPRLSKLFSDPEVFGHTTQEALNKTMEAQDALTGALLAKRPRIKEIRAIGSLAQKGKVPIGDIDLLVSTDLPRTPLEKAWFADVSLFKQHPSLEFLLKSDYPPDELIKMIEKGVEKYGGQKFRKLWPRILGPEKKTTVIRAPKAKGGPKLTGKKGQRGSFSLKDKKELERLVKEAEEVDFEVIGRTEKPVVSGHQSPTSLEAITRMKQGKFAVWDVRTNKVRYLTSVDAVDTVLGDYEAMAWIPNKGKPTIYGYGKHFDKMGSEYKSSRGSMFLNILKKEKVE